MRATTLHCIFCGAVLEPFSEQDEEEYFGAQSKFILLHCTGEKCHIKREDGIVLTMHHPERGSSSKPGDSFSVSWIK